jgi:hypothetical protein
VQYEWNPDKSPSGPVSVLASSADKTIYVYRNGVEIGRAEMPNAKVVSNLKNRVFSALEGRTPEGAVRWLEVTNPGKEKTSEALFAMAQKARLSAEFLAKAREIITPGATLIFTDRPVDQTTQSKPGFQIVVAQR